MTFGQKVFVPEIKEMGSIPESSQQPFSRPSPLQVGRQIFFMNVLFPTVAEEVLAILLDRGNGMVCSINGKMGSRLKTDAF